MPYPDFDLEGKISGNISNADKSLTDMVSVSLTGLIVGSGAYGIGLEVLRSGGKKSKSNYRLKFTRFSNIQC